MARPGARVAAEESGAGLGWRRRWWRDGAMPAVSYRDGSRQRPLATISARGFALRFQAGEIAHFIPWRGWQPRVRRIRRAAISVLAFCLASRAAAGGEPPGRLAPAAARDHQREGDPVYHFRCGHARARLGGAMLLDLLGPPGRCSGCWPHDGEVAAGAIFFLAKLLFADSGADDGARDQRRC